MFEYLHPPYLSASFFNIFVRYTSAFQFLLKIDTELSVLVKLLG